MNRYSTRQAATKLGISHNTLARHIASGKLPAPEAIIPGIRPTHVWTEAEIEQVRQLLPKIANGRKTRYEKLRRKESQTGAPALQKKKQPKKKRTTTKTAKS
ncbi:MAG: helix-turn-helix domain-containing protein [Acidobacteriia bacterium]|nr:helix-turn-helix domain-containing protein [Terriglobia bacterium]